MNLQLINPFAHENFPEHVDVSIDTNAQCVRFNNGNSRFAGSFIAIGRTEGVVAILDIETRAYLRFLVGHVKAVTTLCWSRNSRYLVSGSRDHNVIVWDLATGSRMHTLRFDSEVLSVAFHPRNSKILAIVLAGQNKDVEKNAYLVDLREEMGGEWPLDVEEQIRGEGAGAQLDQAASGKKRRERATLARFSPRGDLVFVGTSQGSIHVFDSQTRNHVLAKEISRPSSIKGMEFDKSGMSMVVNSNDRSIRVYALEELAHYAKAIPNLIESGRKLEYFTLLHRFQDLVNRTPWNAVRFSNDGEYIVGGAGHKAAHQIYLWDNGTGSLSKILEGPKDPLEDLDWHPIKPICASVSSDQGLLHMWATKIPERWSAYAPGFEELEENLEYQEREDEFDVEDESEVEKRKMNVQEVFVDIEDSDVSTSIPLPPTHAFDENLRTYLASSEAWADVEPDEDADDAFSIPLDVDLDDMDKENRDTTLLVQHVA